MSTLFFTFSKFVAMYLKHKTPYDILFILTKNIRHLSTVSISRNTRGIVMHERV